MTHYTSAHVQRRSSTHTTKYAWRKVVADRQNNTTRRSIDESLRGFAQVRPSAPSSKSSRKAELMAAARSMGWRGKSYRTAKKFGRKLDREARGA